MTQKRGLGRGLGALIPGGSTPSDEQPLRTRSHPRTSAEPGEAGSSTRPVDMFFSGDPAEAQSAERTRAARGDIAGDMARDARERRAAARAGTRSSRGRGSAAERSVVASSSSPAEAAETTAPASKQKPNRSSAEAEESSTAQAPAEQASSTGRKTTGGKKTGAAKRTSSTKRTSTAKSTAAAKPATAGKSGTAKTTGTGTSTGSSKKVDAAEKPSSAAESPESTTSRDSSGSGDSGASGRSSKATTSTAEKAASAPKTSRTGTTKTTPAPTNEAADDASASTAKKAADAPAAEPETAASESSASESSAEEKASSVDTSPVVDVEPAPHFPAHEDPSDPDPRGASETSEPSTEELPQSAAEATTDDSPEELRETPSAPVEPSSTTSDAAGRAEGDLMPVPGAEFAEIPILEIRENPRNPRSDFDDDQLDELAFSLREVGVLQPVVVRPIPVTENGESFELVMGERRWRAARRAGLATIPAIIRATSDDDLLRDALLENLHRSQLNPLEEAAAYQQLLEDFGCTQDELADRIGRSRPQISNTLRLMRLPALVQRRLASGALSAGHARALLAVEDPRLQEELAQRIVSEGLSVRETERLASRGLEPAGQRSAPRRTSYNPRVVDLTSRLSNRLEAPVKIDVGKRKGRITMEFSNLEDLERLAGRIGLDLGDSLSSQDE
jgi:ParB family chromosome partitioning protein